MGCGVVAVVVAVAVADAMRFATSCSIHSCWAGVNEGTDSPSSSVIVVRAWMDGDPNNEHAPV